MTGIVVRELEQNRFSFSEFYLARVRRILPDLISVCLAVLMFIWWVLTPADYKLVGSHSAYSLTFLSNINSWFDVGYFAASAHEKWLLHTWSLSVEWQFYLIFPVGLCLIWKFFPTRRAVIIACGLVFYISLIICIVSTPDHSSFAFFFYSRSPGKC